MKMKKYTKKELISLYKTLAEKLGVQPTKKQWNEDSSTPSDMPIRMYFKTWNTFVKVCGYKTYKPYLSELAIKNKILAKKGKRSTNWKGGRIKDKFGYIQIWMPDHPNAKMAGYIHEHRLKISNKLGRPLEQQENIHHKNGKRDDNRLCNLELWNTMQPAGQKIEDKIKYAKQILKLYENY